MLRHASRVSELVAFQTPMKAVMASSSGI
jgi:hypothetical protein